MWLEVKVILSICSEVCLKGIFRQVHLEHFI